MRVFVAIDVPDDVRRALGDLIATLEKTCRGARWMHTEAMHITLKFIGEVNEETVKRIRNAMAGVRAAGPIEIHFRGTGFFPNASHPRVFWAGIEAPPTLAELAADIEQSLEPLGIPREDRAFKPHLTLARFKSEEGLPNLRETLEQLGPSEFGATIARSFHLYQSVLKAAGAEHTRIASFAFAEGGA